MIKAIIVVLAVVAIVSAGLLPGQERGTWVEGEISTGAKIPGTPVPGKGGNALFIFDSFCDAQGFAWGKNYWNPTDEAYPSSWSYDMANPSTAQPDGSPYHWNGGLGTALTNLGYSWEWYPTYDNSEGLQTIPDVITLGEYDVVFVHTFDYWWTENPAISDDARTVLSNYMDAGGKVVLVGQDLHWSGVSPTWLDTYFACGTVTDDVFAGVETVPATGTAGTFAAGWAGTSLKTNFTDSNGFYTDDVSTNGCIGDASYQFASFNDALKCVYSTFEFETCAASEVEALATLIMDYVGAGGALENATWGQIKASF